MAVHAPCELDCALGGPVPLDFHIRAGRPAHHKHFAQNIALRVDLSNAEMGAVAVGKGEIVAMLSKHGLMLRFQGRGVTVPFLSTVGALGGNRIESEGMRLSGGACELCRRP